MCHAIHWYAKANNKCMKYYDKNKESLFMYYWGVNNLYRWTMSQNFIVNSFRLVENTFNLIKIL